MPPTRASGLAQIGLWVSLFLAPHFELTSHLTLPRPPWSEQVS
jgi:hypothetical protein